MKWDPSLDIGIPAIDRQHRELLDHIVSILIDSESRSITESLNFMQGYMQQHFAYEEEMQNKYGYPKIEEHVQSHRDFFFILSQLEDDYRINGEGILLMLRIMQTLINWFLEHIAYQDKLFGDYLKSLDPRPDILTT
ncbi:MAG: hemerythrin family protein [Planctomycetota bacterium]|jgi:hemerythrin|nr:hemerythrin family protein [Planctomycetota bacterium]